MTSIKTVRNIRKVERPRPLRLNPDVNKCSLSSPSDNVIKTKSTSDILVELEALHLNLDNCIFDENTAAEISKLCTVLKLKGEELNITHKDQMDHFFVTLRNISRDDRLDVVSRMKLLEIIEIKAMHWKSNENVSNYFKSKILELEQGIDRSPLCGSSSSPNIAYIPMQTQVSSVNALPLAPGEILRSSGKFPKPTKIIGKQYVKDEIIIRNSDSGKVMGIKGRRVHMIEELSDTVISFQRVSPGARDRLVQITGPHEEAIGHAKILVEDTIRRNASPIREKVDFLEAMDNNDLNLNNTYTDNQPFTKNQLSHSLSMSDASMREYSFPLHIGRDVIRLSGKKLELLKTAQLVLTEYFTGQLELQEKQNEILPPVSPPISSSFSDNFQGYDLKRESSLKTSAFQSCYTSSWMNPSPKISSPSPFSSSEEEFGKDSTEDKNTNFATNAVMRTQEPRKLPSPVSLESRDTGSTNIREKFTRSSSVPTDVFNQKNQTKSEDVRRFSNEQMEVPVIPAPVYKQRKYNRDFLLSCAKLPLSHNKPANFDEILKNYSLITCESPIMFNPSTLHKSS